MLAKQRLPGNFPSDKFLPDPEKQLQKEVSVLLHLKFDG